MKKTYIILLSAVLLGVAACTHKTHFEVDMPQDEQSDKYPAPDGIGYLGNDLAWEDIADVKSDITHLKYTVTGANGVKEVKEFASPSEASKWIIPLPVGEYDVLVAANMDSGNGFELGEALPTKESPNPVGHTLPATYSRLTNASSNPHQAWNGIAHVKAEKDVLSTVHLDLDRLLALFTLSIKNVPEGTTIDVSMGNAANYVTLTDERTASHWGLPSEEISDDITLGQLNAANALSAIDEFKVFPTATGLDNTTLTFHIKTNHDIDLDYVGIAPKMENGRKYVLDLDYNKLTPFMYITSVSINDWTDGWAISGEILNPSN